MAIFSDSMNLTMKYEGSYSNDPDDPGGETKYGISKRQYPYIDIKNLTLDLAKGIYKRDYWDKMKLDKVTDQSLAEKIFDIGVNMGINKAGKIAQQACNILLDQDLVEDGIIGKKTIDAINSTNHKKSLLKVIISIRINLYLKICYKTPKLKKFLAGWILRA